MVVHDSIAEELRHDLWLTEVRPGAAQGRPAIPDLDHLVDLVDGRGEAPSLIMLVGPSGGGRSTALRLVADRAERRGLRVATPVLPALRSGAAPDIAGCLHWALGVMTGADLSRPLPSGPTLVRRWLDGQRGMLVLDDLHRFGTATDVVRLLRRIVGPECAVIGAWAEEEPSLWPDEVLTFGIHREATAILRSTAGSVFGAAVDDRMLARMQEMGGTDRSGVKRLAGELSIGGRVQIVDGHAVLKRSGTAAGGGAAVPSVDQRFATGEWRALLSATRDQRVNGRLRGRDRLRAVQVLVHMGQLGRARRWLDETAGGRRIQDVAAERLPGAVIGQLGDEDEERADARSQGGAQLLADVVEGGLRSRSVEDRRRAGRAADVLVRAASMTGWSGTPMLAGWALLATGSASRNAEDTVRLAREFGDAFWLARCLLAAADDADDPAVPLRESFSLFASAGARPWLVRVGAKMTVLGCGRSRAMATIAAEARRSAVRRAVVDGLSNDETARLLGLSRPAVGRTVIQLLQATGAPNRTALAALGAPW